MPGFDGSGPMGMGPMTGGGRGYCAVALSGADRPFARGGNSGRGGGRGFRHMYFATGLPGWARAQQGMQAFGSPGFSATKEEQAAILKQQAELLKGQVENIQSRIQALEVDLKPNQE